MNRKNGPLGKGDGGDRWGNKFDDMPGMNGYDWRNEKDDMDNYLKVLYLVTI